MIVGGSYCVMLAYKSSRVFQLDKSGAAKCRFQFFQRLFGLPRNGSLKWKVREPCDQFKRLPPHPTPKKGAIPTARNALIRIFPGSLHLLQSKVSDALIFFHGRIERGQRMSLKRTCVVAECTLKPSIAPTDHAVFRIYEPDWGMIERKGFKVIFLGTLCILRITRTLFFYSLQESQGRQVWMRK